MFIGTTSITALMKCGAAVSWAAVGGLGCGRRATSDLNVSYLASTFRDMVTYGRRPLHRQQRYRSLDFECLEVERSVYGIYTQVDRD